VDVVIGFIAAIVVFGLRLFGARRSWKKVSGNDHVWQRPFEIQVKWMMRTAFHGKRRRMTGGPARKALDVCPGFVHPVRQLLRGPGKTGTGIFNDPK
jgi:hypothetical protein